VKDGYVEQLNNVFKTTTIHCNVIVSTLHCCKRVRLARDQKATDLLNHLLTYLQLAKKRTQILVQPTYSLADGLDVKCLEFLIDFSSSALQPTLKVCRREEFPTSNNTLTHQQADLRLRIYYAHISWMLLNGRHHNTSARRHSQLSASPFRVCSDHVTPSTVV